MAFSHVWLLCWLSKKMQRSAAGSRLWLALLRVWSSRGATPSSIRAKFLCIGFPAEESLAQRGLAQTIALPLWSASLWGNRQFPLFLQDSTNSTWERRDPEADSCACLSTTVSQVAQPGCSRSWRAADVLSSARVRGRWCVDWAGICTLCHPC